MNIKRKQKRYKVTVNEEFYGEFTSIENIAKEVGCSLQLLYKSRNKEGVFSYGGIKYTIIDKLDLI